MKREQPKVIRCAIYTRKSSDEGLEQDFNTLDSQREYCEAFIKSQTGLGWTCLADRYDDGGFSGGTLNRPAFKRLMADIDAGRIDCIVVYKYERFSRSLLDFLNLLAKLEAKGVTFVSVTQQFNTSTSAGRMSLNIMLSLAQYERENASERTRDKIAAARRKGKWAGGHPLLGYDIERDTKALALNADEAERVRELFRLYIEHERLIAVVREAARRGWVNKRWTTSKGTILGGRPFDKASLRMLLLNVAYIGLVRHKNATYPGQHEAIVDERTFRKVGDLLKRNGRTGGAIVRNKHGALLRGLLHCGCCNCAMRFSYSSKAGRLRYCYYVCSNATTRGWNECPSPSVPAGEIEKFIVDRIRALANDPKLIAEIVRQGRPETDALIASLEDERDGIAREHNRLQVELRDAVASTASHSSSHIAARAEHLAAAERRLAELAREIETLRCTQVNEQEVLDAFVRFDDLWQALTPHERVQVVHLIIKRIEWDGREERIKITFHPTGLRGFVDRTNITIQEVAA